MTAGRRGPTGRGVWTTDVRGPSIRAPGVITPRGRPGVCVTSVPIEVPRYRGPGGRASRPRSARLRRPALRGPAHGRTPARRPDEPQLQGHAPATGGEWWPGSSEAGSGCWPSTGRPSTTTACAAASTGIAPRVVDVSCRTSSGVLRRRMGRRADLSPTPTSTTRTNLRRRRRRLPRAARRARGSPTTSTCSPCSARYLAVVRERGFRLPDGYLDFARRSGGSRRARRPAAGDRRRATTTCSPRTSGRRRAALAHRLRVLRQQRPLLRARQHLERGRPGRRPARASGRGVLRRAVAPAASPAPGCGR